VLLAVNLDAGPVSRRARLVLRPPETAGVTPSCSGSQHGCPSRLLSHVWRWQRGYPAPHPASSAARFSGARRPLPWPGLQDVTLELRFKRLRRGQMQPRPGAYTEYHGGDRGGRRSSGKTRGRPRRLPRNKTRKQKQCPGGNNRSITARARRTKRGLRMAPAWVDYLIFQVFPLFPGDPRQGFRGTRSRRRAPKISNPNQLSPRPDPLPLLSAPSNRSRPMCNCCTARRRLFSTVFCTP